MNQTRMDPGSGCFVPRKGKTVASNNNAAVSGSSSDKSAGNSDDGDKSIQRAFHQDPSIIFHDPLAETTKSAATVDARPVHPAGYAAPELDGRRLRTRTTGGQLSRAEAIKAVQGDLAMLSLIRPVQQNPRLRRIENLDGDPDD